jgi:nuclear transport factor 2 (NTF2) superfamily protein
MTPARDQLRDFARRYTEAWCSQDPERVAENYAPDGSLTINDGAPSVGRAAITDAARSFMVAFPDMQVLMDGLVVRGESAEYRWTLVGTNTGPGGTGRRVRISGFEEWTIGDDGLIARSLGHYDQDEYDRQLEHGVQELP